jgi:hypothetical protein
VAISVCLVHRGMARRFVDDLNLAGAEPHARAPPFGWGRWGGQRSESPTGSSGC